MGGTLVNDHQGRAREALPDHGGGDDRQVEPAGGRRRQGGRRAGRDRDRQGEHGDGGPRGGRAAQDPRPGGGEGPGGCAHRRDRRRRRGRLDGDRRGRIAFRLPRSGTGGEGGPRRADGGGPRPQGSRRIVAPPPPAPAPAAKVAPAAPTAAAPVPKAPVVSSPPGPAPVVPFPAGRVKASPLARAHAPPQNISLRAPRGTGPGGRIIKRDIEGYLAVPAAAGGALAAPRSVPTITPGQELPLSSMRRTIARRLSESKFTAPHFYVTVEIDMDAAVSLREQLQQAEEIKVSFNDLVVKACARALTRFPSVNASWAGEKIVTHAEVHVGVAVSIPDGLIPPVVRNADRTPLLEISRQIKDLASRARERKLRPEEFAGSTFTVSNLRIFHFTKFTAIINP